MMSIYIPHMSRGLMAVYNSLRVRSDVSSQSISDLTPPIQINTQRPDHNTGNHVPYSLRIVSGFFRESYLLQTRVVRRNLRFLVLIRED